MAISCVQCEQFFCVVYRCKWRFFLISMSADRKRRWAPLHRPTFKGNKYMKVEIIDGKKVLVPRNSDSAASDVSDNAVPSVSRQNETDIPVVEETATPTRSQIKIEELYTIMKESDNESDSETEDSDKDAFVNVDLDLTNEKLEGNRLVDIGILGRNLSSQLFCRYCHCDVQLIELKRQGLGSEYVFHCSNRRCNEQISFPSCTKVPVGNTSINSVNRRAVLAMRSIGGGRSDLHTFCGIMNVPPPLHASSYNIINKTLHDAACSVQVASMKRAAEIELEMAEPVEGETVRDIDVSVDGSWMTRGHSSKVGVTSLIGCVTGKVLDSGVLSKTCKSCDYYSKKDKHRILEEIGLSAGIFCRDFCEQKDILRILNAERRANEGSLKARRARRRARLAQDEQQEEAEGYPYQAGGH